MQYWLAFFAQQKAQRAAIVVARAHLSAHTPKPRKGWYFDIIKSANYYLAPL